VLPVMFGIKNSEAYAKYNEAKNLPEVVSEDDCAQERRAIGTRTVPGSCRNSGALRECEWILDERFNRRDRQ
jgi:hypothetical protein